MKIYEIVNNMNYYITLFLYIYIYILNICDFKNYIKSFEFFLYFPIFNVIAYVVI